MQILWIGVSYSARSVLRIRLVVVKWAGEKKRVSSFKLSVFSRSGCGMLRRVGLRRAQSSRAPACGPDGGGWKCVRCCPESFRGAPGDFGEGTRFRTRWKVLADGHPCGRPPPYRFWRMIFGKKLHTANRRNGRLPSLLNLWRNWGMKNELSAECGIGELAAGCRANPHAGCMRYRGGGSRRIQKCKYLWKERKEGNGRLPSFFKSVE
jgi:hypothetical protein